MKAPISMRSGRMLPARRNWTLPCSRRAQVFVDDPAQAIHSGEINVPISRGLYRADEIAGTLGEVVIGKKRRSDRTRSPSLIPPVLPSRTLPLRRLRCSTGGRIAVPVRGAIASKDPLRKVITRTLTILYKLCRPIGGSCHPLRVKRWVHVITCRFQK